MVTSSTSSTNSQPIVFAGLVSGLDTKTMIQQLINARKGPITIMQAKVSIRQQEQSALKDITTRLANLMSVVKKFDDPGYIQAKSASVAAGGSSAAVSVSADPAAATGSYRITVAKLATTTSVSSAAALSAPITTATLLTDSAFATSVTTGTFTVNGQSIDVQAGDTLQNVLDRIQTKTGVTAALVNDSSGRPNRLQLAGGADIALGSTGDTSNFLSAMKLLASPGGATRTSTANVGATQTGALLSAVNFVTPLGSAAGSFKINGAEISYDGSRDSLSTVLNRINNSTAGVTATYDSVNDKVTLVSKTTGSTAIAMENVTGDFLGAIGVRGTAQTMGRNAEIQVDSGAGPVTYYSTTNTVKDAVAGLTINLLKEGGATDTITVGQDIDGAVSRVRDFVSQVNSTIDFINQQTKIDTKTNNNGAFAADPTISQLADGVRRIITDTIDGVSTGKRTLAELGVTYGAIGSKPGTTSLLQLDETKLRDALLSDPAGAANVIGAFRATAALTGGNGGIQGISGDPTGVKTPGRYTINTTVNGDGTANITASFAPRDGSQGTVTTLTNVAAGSTSASLIAGVTVTFAGAFANGTNTVDVQTPVRGISAKMQQYLDPLTRDGGILSQRQDAAKTDIDDMNNQVTRMNDRLDAERTRLQSQFARMESALSRLQSQRSALQSLAQVAGG